MKPTICLTCLLIAPTTGWCQKESSTVEQIAHQARDSIVVVTTENRDGGDGGMGTGFVIDPKGLIATSLHVIGEARPIWVQTREGKRLEVTEVFASDRNLDLAIVRVDFDQPQPALSLAESELADGEAVVAIGHPLGLKNSVVNGVVAGERTFGGAAMWQVAMIIEPGNSGGPLLDMRGNVHGVVAMKSIGREPFGFAVNIAELKKLLDRPNPISIKQWKTIGQIDASRWQAMMGARWRQRSGRLLVEGPGQGFGGRSLLLRQDDPPQLPFEVTVTVKLDDESGAAGLVVHADGEHRHYGFYPSSGRLRLTSFEGPTVFTWKVIEDVESEHYKRGDWNELKVRVEENKIVGFVNGHEVVSVDEVRQAPGRVGLCKFRDTKAEFKHFEFGERVPSRLIATDKLAQLTNELEQLGSRTNLLDIDLIGQSTDVNQRLAVLELQARDFEAKAQELRRIRNDIHIAAVCSKLHEIVTKQTDDEIDLLAGALWIAKLDNSELDVQSYVNELELMVGIVRRQFRPEMSATDRLALLNKYLFEQNGFHGSRTDYDNVANSHLDRVIDDREGLPITLSVLYMVMAKQLGLKVVGVGLPGHFVVRHEPKGGTPQLIDVFERGKRLSRNEANVKVYQATRYTPRDSDFEAATHKSILVRMLSNLRFAAEQQEDSTSMHRYVEALVAISPDDAGLRGIRGVLRHKEGRKQAAIDDLNWILEQASEGIDLNQVRKMRDLFSQ